MADVRIEGVSKYFGNFAAVKEVTTVFEEGTVTVLLGPSGCGKTTLMRMIVGLETPTTGSVFIGDQDVTRVPTNKRRIGMVFQYPVIYRGTTVARNLELPLIAAKMDAAARKKRIEEIAEIVGLADSLESNVDRLDNAGRIVQLDSPRVVYNKPDDVFAGWFLGSPGMNFIKTGFVVEGSSLHSPLLAEPLSVTTDAQHAVTMGIRPEQVVASLEQKPGSVNAQVTDKAITIGGQVLLDLKVQDVQLKAIVAHEVGKEAASTVWVNLPRQNIHLFDSKDRRIEAGLQTVS